MIKHKHKLTKDNIARNSVRTVSKKKCKVEIKLRIALKSAVVSYSLVMTRTSSKNKVGSALQACHPLAIPDPLQVCIESLRKTCDSAENELLR